MSEETKLNHVGLSFGIKNLGTKLKDVIDLANELRTIAGEDKTAVDELIDDHATSRTAAVNVIAALKNVCLKKAGLAKGSTASRLAQANDVQYTVDGTIYSAAAQSGVFTAAHGFSTVAGNVNARGFLLQLSSDGTMILSAAAATGGGSGVTYPSRTSTLCPIGKLKLVIASGSTAFSAGQALTASHITASYTDVMISLEEFSDPPATLSASDPSATTEGAVEVVS